MKLIINVLFYCALFISGNIFAQTYQVQLKVIDQMTDSAIFNAQIKMDGKLIGFTNLQGEYVFKNGKKDDLYTFVILPNNYEAKMYQVQALDSLTICNPSIKIRKLNWVKVQYFQELQKVNPNTLWTSELLNSILRTFAANNNIKEKNEFVKIDSQYKSLLIDKTKIDKLLGQLSEVALILNKDNQNNQQ